MSPGETSIQMPAAGDPSTTPKQVAKTPAKVVAPPVRKAKPKRARATGRRAAQSPADLDRLARRLEADWQTALRKHEEAVHKKFHDLRAALHKRRTANLKGKAIADLRETLAPKLKPKKGRLKDLGRVETALGDALSRI